MIQSSGRTLDTRDNLSLWRRNSNVPTCGKKVTVFGMKPQEGGMLVDAAHCPVSLSTTVPGTY